MTNVDATDNRQTDGTEIEKAVNTVYQIVTNTDTTGAGIAQLVVLGLAVHSVTGSILLWGHFR